MQIKRLIDFIIDDKKSDSEEFLFYKEIIRSRNTFESYSKYSLDNFQGVECETGGQSQNKNLNIISRVQLITCQICFMGYIFV
jgi:hypothetical protein